MHPLRIIIVQIEITKSLSCSLSFSPFLWVFAGCWVVRCWADGCHRRNSSLTLICLLRLIFIAAILLRALEMKSRCDDVFSLAHVQRLKAIFWKMVEIVEMQFTVTAVLSVAWVKKAQSWQPYKIKSRKKASKNQPLLCTVQINIHNYVEYFISVNYGF